MDLGPYYATLTASDRLRVLVEELRWSGPTREILRELGCLGEELEEAEQCCEHVMIVETPPTPLEPRTQPSGGYGGGTSLARSYEDPLRCS